MSARRGDLRKCWESRWLRIVDKKVCSIASGEIFDLEAFGCYFGFAYDDAVSGYLGGIGELGAELFVGKDHCGSVS